MNPQTEFTIVKEKTFDVIRSAVNKMVDQIRPTYGPASNKVIIDKPMYRMVVDDGVQIARDFELPDPAENAVVKLVRETAVKTNDRVGDGTTGALIMLQAIINEVAKKNRPNGRKIELELKRGAEESKNQLNAISKKIKTKEDLKKVARISFDDEKISDMIADVYSKLGKDATITVDHSQTMESFLEMAPGQRLDVGYVSPYMINNPQRMESVLDNAAILITDYRLTESSDIMPIMEKMQNGRKEGKEKRKSLVLVCENIEYHALSTMVINLPQVMNPHTRQPGTFPAVAINLPKVEDRKTLLEDLALLTGAKVFTMEKGDKLENATLEDLGTCEKFICRKDESIFVKPKGKKMEIALAIETLKKALEAETDNRSKEVLKYRIGMFSNSLATIKVGAPTDNERKTLKYKVEDAVNAVKSAFNHGVVPGSGIALASLKTSSSILNEALKYPHRQLMDNMGLEENTITDVKETALNVVTGKTGNFMDVGVVDPVDVLIAGIESAVSISSILITSSGMIVESPKQINEK